MNKRHSSWIVFTNSLAAIPVFPRPTTPDRPINPNNSPLQFNGTGRYWTGCYFWNLIFILKRGCPPLGRGRSPSQGLPPHWYIYFNTGDCNVSAISRDYSKWLLTTFCIWFFECNRWVGSEANNPTQKPEQYLCITMYVCVSGEHT